MPNWYNYLQGALTFVQPLEKAALDTFHGGAGTTATAVVSAIEVVRSVLAQLQAAQVPVVDPGAVHPDVHVAAEANRVAALSVTGTTNLAP